MKKVLKSRENFKLFLKKRACKLFTNFKLSKVLNLVSNYSIIYVFECTNVFKNYSCHDQISQHFKFWYTKIDVHYVRIEFFFKKFKLFSVYKRAVCENNTMFASFDLVNSNIYNPKFLKACKLILETLLCYEKINKQIDLYFEDF